MGGPAKQELVLKNKIFRQYVYDNHAYWYEFAEKKGLEVEFGDIILVSGFVKTSEWALSVFGKSTKAHEFSVKATVGNFGGADFSVAEDTEFDMPMQRRCGPKRPSAGKTQSADTPDGMPSNQCLFLRYYRVYDRLLFDQVAELPDLGAAAMCCIPCCCLPFPSFCRRKPRPRRRHKKVHKTIADQDDAKAAEKAAVQDHVSELLHVGGGDENAAEENLSDAQPERLRGGAPETIDEVTPPPHDPQPSIEEVPNYISQVF